MKLTLLGTGSPVPSLKRASSSYMIEAGDDVILLDHGPGAFNRLMQAGKTPADVTHVFFSHLHFDHCGDFARLFHHRWDAVGGMAPPMKVYGPPGTQKMVERLFGPEGAYALDLLARTSHEVSINIYRGRGGKGDRPWPEVDVTELSVGAGIVEGGGWRLIRDEVIHHQPYLESFGFRMEADGASVVYTSDVRLSGAKGPVAALYDLARDADVLVHYLNGFTWDEDRPGVPKKQELVAMVARDAGVKTLVTTHHGPAIDADGVRERVIADICAIYHGKVIWGQDLMTFTAPET